MFFDFQGQKVLLKAEFEGTPGLLAQARSIFFRFACSPRGVRVLMGLTRTANDEIMTDLVTISRFDGSP